MQLKNDRESLDALCELIENHFRARGHTCDIFDYDIPSADSNQGCGVRFLLHRKNVIEYRISKDRGVFVASVALGIGPHYFPPMMFWNFENAERFSMNATTEAVTKNLSILEEYFEIK